MKPRLRNVLTTGAMLIVLSVHGSHAAETAARATCTDWLRQDSGSKADVVYGWLIAVDVMRSLVAIEEDVETLLWPKGYHVGSVVAEIEEACRKPENRNLELEYAVVIVAGTLNVVQQSQADEPQRSPRVKIDEPAPTSTIAP